jgi:hypothetical protein
VGLRLRRSILGAALLGAAAVLGAICASPRALTTEEDSFLRETREALSGLVPEAPAGWVRRGLVSAVTAGPLCDDPVYQPPLFVRVSAAYLPRDAPELSEDRRAAESAAWQSRLAAASREEAEAVKIGDKPRIERARQVLRDLRAHPVPTPPAVPPRSARRLDVRLQVNPASFQPCAKSEPLEIEEAASAFRATTTTCRDRTAGDVYLVAFGPWKTKPSATGARLAAFNEWPAPPVARAKVHTALAEIFGDPEAVDAAVRGFDPVRLRSLLAR